MKSKPIASFFDHFPKTVAEYCFNLWHEHHFKFIVSKSRHSKYGDYRFHPTYLHEVAHLLTYLQYKNKVLPHGLEWKNKFKELFEPILNEELLPKELVSVLQIYLENPAASSAVYAPLVEVLKKFEPATPFVLLKDLPENSAFTIKNLVLIKRGFLFNP